MLQNPFPVELFTGLGHKTLVLVVITRHKRPVAVVVKSASQVEGTPVAIERGRVLKKRHGPAGLL